MNKFKKFMKNEKTSEADDDNSDNKIEAFSQSTADFGGVTFKV